MSNERRRLTLALLLSLLIHTLLLSLTFGGQGPGLPGFGFPWQERRIEAPDLRVVLMPPRVTAAKSSGTPIEPPLRPASIDQPVAGGPALMSSASPAPNPDSTAAAIAPRSRPAARAKPTSEAKPAPAGAPVAPPAQAPVPNEATADAAPTSIPGPVVIARERSDEAKSIVPAAASVPTPVIAAGPGASTPDTATPAPRDTGDAARERVEQDAREPAIERAKLDRSEREAQRQAALSEAARQEAARQEAQRAETARLEAERQEAARQAVARQEAVRQEAARQEAARQEAQRTETARLEAERQEAARQAAARQEAVRVEAAQEEAAKREAARRAMGRQLDEEAARREAASPAAVPASRPLPSSSGVRRGRLFGRADANAELVLYAEAWARKIQLNMTFDMVRDAARRPHTDPLVTVAIRADGSVESVTIVMSSGVAEIDEAVRRIVHSQVPYPAFPPGLAREFDVIEIRRTWHFDMAIRLY